MSSASLVMRRCSEIKLSHWAWKAVVCASTALKFSESEDRRVSVEVVLASSESRWS